MDPSQSQGAFSTGSNSAQTTPQTNQEEPAQQPSTPIGGGQTTEPFLKDFTLLAEAARRAQMGIMVRDLESFGLS